MSLAAHLFKLQQLDLELQSREKELAEVKFLLSDDKALVAAETRLASHRAQLEDDRKEQRRSEWELEDLQDKIRQIGGKLYSGTTRNPKELVNLEIELKGFQSQIKPKEDTLLKSMDRVEEVEAEVRATTEELDLLKREWQERQETMSTRKADIETLLSELRENRQRLVEQVAPEALSVYERTRAARGQAVVKVERGKCQGCHITVPTSQWQKARAGDLIQCNSCSRILYLE